MNEREQLLQLLQLLEGGYSDSDTAVNPLPDDDNDDPESVLIDPEDVAKLAEWRRRKKEWITSRATDEQVHAMLERARDRIEYHQLVERDAQDPHV